MLSICCSFSQSLTDSLQPHGLYVAYQASLSFTISWSLLRLMSIELMMPSNHLILCRPLLPSIILNIRVYSNKSALPIRWPKYWSFSFSISPSNEYSGLFLLGLTVLISLLSKGLSRVFSNTSNKYLTSRDIDKSQLGHLRRTEGFKWTEMTT